MILLRPDRMQKRGMRSARKNKTTTKKKKKKKKSAWCHSSPLPLSPARRLTGQWNSGLGCQPGLWIRRVCSFGGNMVLFCKITERPKFSEQIIIIIIKGVILFLYFSNFTFYVLLRFQLQTSKFLSLFQVLDFTFFLFSLSFFTRSLSVKNSQSVSESRY